MCRWLWVGVSGSSTRPHPLPTPDGHLATPSPATTEDWARPGRGGGWYGGFKDALGGGGHVCSVHSAQLAPAAPSASGYYLVIFMELNLKEV